MQEKDPGKGYNDQDKDICWTMKYFTKAKP
jgi:hypothetical protein